MSYRYISNLTSYLDILLSCCLQTENDCSGAVFIASVRGCPFGWLKFLVRLMLVVLGGVGYVGSCCVFCGLVFFVFCGSV